MLTQTIQTPVGEKAMRVACFSSKSYDEEFLSAAAKESRHEFRFLQPRLDESTVVLADGSDAVCVFVNDSVDDQVCRQLAERAIRSIVLRCAGFNNVDLRAAKEHSIRVARVP